MVGFSTNQLCQMEMCILIQCMSCKVATHGQHQINQFPSKPMYTWMGLGLVSPMVHGGELGCPYVVLHLQCILFQRAIILIRDDLNMHLFMINNSYLVEIVSMCLSDINFYITIIHTR